jgi:hypothetical protein
MNPRLHFEVLATGAVILKSQTAFSSAKNKHVICVDWRDPKYNASIVGYRSDISNYEPPLNTIHLEFERPRQLNDVIIKEIHQKLDRLGYEYCIFDHRGKSPYIVLYNIRNLPEGQEFAFKKWFCKEVLKIPDSYRLDISNLADRTLVPFPEHVHWKYDTVHEMIAGLPPLRQRNKIPDEVLAAFFRFIESQKVFSCDVITIDPDEAKRVWDIIYYDRYVRMFFDGSVNVLDPSVSRMKLLCCLASFGLSEGQIRYAMGFADDRLHWHNKPHVHRIEPAKAIAFWKRKGGVLRKICNLV